ncbi:MAG TPA: ABC transporter permease [Gemmatimonadales bacterium]|nr:ABC transporter permease [Gemmatimonadales bacterium]HET9151903.1 ABC transporter permease [Gemmatimonadales bacterium]HSE51947.1 ABC transporter permease [Gemmatimonadales bacterium]
MTEATAVLNTPRRGVLTDFREIAHDIRKYRELMFEFARRDIRIRYKQAVMGFGWAVFMPILIVLSGVLIRTAMGQASGSGVGRADIAAIALKGIGWAFFAGAVTFGTSVLTGNQNLIAKVYFPREVLPLAALLAQTFDSTIGFIALVILLPFLGVTLHASILWVPLLLAILWLLTAAIVVFLSCANLFFRDVKYIVQVVLTFGILFTPVFYEPAMMGPKGAWLMWLNPLTPILEGLRLSVVRGHNLAAPLSELGKKGVEVAAWYPTALFYSAAWAVLGLILASLLFHRAQPAFAENV